ncbi:MAG: hypothetical protein FJY65_05510 [Calditrichaeota bacterium]|nr:hypothetical protein [Calditrichota bacterium]
MAQQTLDHRQVIEHTFAAGGGCHGDDIPPGADYVERFDLMAKQPLYAQRFKSFAQTIGQRLERLSIIRLLRTEKFQMSERRGGLLIPSDGLKKLHQRAVFRRNAIKVDMGQIILFLL